jgi:hypothetical protein
MKKVFFSLLVLGAILAQQAQAKVVTIPTTTTVTTSTPAKAVNDVAEVSLAITSLGNGNYSIDCYSSEDGTGVLTILDESTGKTISEETVVLTNNHYVVGRAFLCGRYPVHFHMNANSNNAATETIVVLSQ